MISLDNDEYSSDDSEMSAEIPMPRYSQQIQKDIYSKSPTNVNITVSNKSVPKNEINLSQNRKTSHSDSSSGTIEHDNKGLFSISEAQMDSRNCEFEQDSKGHTFMLNQPVSVDAPTSSSSLFSRKQFISDIIESEKKSSEGGMLCVLVSTYGLDEVNFLKEIPLLFGPTARIPTMILYGKKISTSKGAMSKTQEAAWLGQSTKAGGECSLKNVSPVISTVQMNPRHRSASFMGYSDNGKGILGVHHPKYVLLFTRRGIHVLISTANMTPQVNAAEGTFTDFFPIKPISHRNPTGMKESNIYDDAVPENDFGDVLDDFLNKQAEQLGDVHTYSTVSPTVITEAAKVRTLLKPTDWRLFYGTSSPHIDDIKKGNVCGTSLVNIFDFSKAKVHLVSVVPGCFPIRSPHLKLGVFDNDDGLLRKCSQESLTFDTNLRAPKKQQRRKCKQCLLERERLHSHNIVVGEGGQKNDDLMYSNTSTENGFIEYGAARIQALLLKLEPCLQRAPRRSDAVVMQPTSIGAGVDNKYMSELLRAYMPEAQWDSDIDGCSQLEGRRLDSLRILWPEAPFMHDTGAISSEDVFDPRNGRVRDNDDTESDDEIDSRLNDTRVKNIEDAQLVFLLPRTLAMMEPDLQSQLHVYKAYPWNSFPLPKFRQETCVTSIASVSNEVSFNINSTHQHNVSQLQDHSVISPAATKASHTIPPPPHIKSYARVLLSSDSTSRAANESKSESSKCTCYDLMWFLLTSACLSKGGQGKLIQPKPCKDCGSIKEGYIEYKNFELGVLYHSGYVREAAAETRGLNSYMQYKAYNRSCMLHTHPILGPPDKAIDSRCQEHVSSIANVSTVVLPVPYDMMDSDPFCGSKGFLKEPYFHDKSELRKYDSQLGLVELAAKRTVKSETKKRNSNVAVVSASTAISRASLNVTIDKGDQVEYLVGGFRASDVHAPSTHTELTSSTECTSTNNLIPKQFNSSSCIDTSKTNGIEKKFFAYDYLCD